MHMLKLIKVLKASRCQIYVVYEKKEFVLSMDHLVNSILFPFINCFFFFFSDLFLPCPDNLLANLHESRELVVDLLSNLPKLFESNYETGSALGAALQAALKLMVSSVGFF